MKIQVRPAQVQLTKKEQEFIYFNRFASLWDEYPDGFRVYPEECPDFIMFNHDSGERIGVEVTRMMLSKANFTHFTTLLRNSVERQITWSARDNFFLQRNIPLHLSIAYEDHLHVDNQRASELAREISQLVSEEVDEFESRSAIQFVLKENLPDEVAQIDGFYVPGARNAVWFPHIANGVPDIDNQLIMSVIGKKERKVERYKAKAPTCYLLIVEGVFPLGYFDRFYGWDQLINSKFEKIFLLRYLNNDLYQLK